MAGVKRPYLGALDESNKPRSAEMAVVNPTAAGESNEVDLSDKLATREVWTFAVFVAEVALA